MTLKEHATIAFSSALVGGSVDKKQNALHALIEYIEQHDALETLERNDKTVLETIYSLFVSFVERNDLAKQYRFTIAIRDLSLDDTRKISAMGFDVFSADGLRLVG